MPRREVTATKAEEKPELVVDQVKIDAINREKDRLTELIKHKWERYVALRAYERDMQALDEQIEQLTMGHTA